jgi:transcriptional regulator with XRE-family HTH domain
VTEGGARARAELVTRLRELRREGLAGKQVTQRHLATALRVSTPLVSSWENLSGEAVPPEERLRDYARFFATDRSLAGDGPRLIPPEELTGDEEEKRRRLIDELIGLRELALAPWPGTAGRLGGRFWHFPEGRQITIIANPLSDKKLGHIEYATPWHPNYVESLRNGDMDSTIELVGHIRAENPGSEVRYMTYDRVSADNLTGHLVILGGADTFVFPHVPKGESHQLSPLSWLIRRLGLPIVTRLPDDKDDEYDTEFVVLVDGTGTPGIRGNQEEIYRPTFIRRSRDDSAERLLVHDQPQLEYDVALLVRRPNPLNTAASLTICSGIFSRGTYGAVRATTDAQLRTSNEQWIAQNLGLEEFWLLLQVPVYQTPTGGVTLTPDLQRPFTRLRSS